MRPLVRRVPQLHRLAVFDAVARAGGFGAAARTLEVSQPAVSRHMAALTRELGVQLFTRRGRTLQLTTSGQVLADAVDQAFLGLEQVLPNLVDQGDVLVVAVQPAMATTWVVPLLDRLETAAECEIRLQIFDRRSELDGTGWDLAIVPGRGEWDGWEVTTLFPEAVRPLASPGYAADNFLDAGSSAQELVHANLLHIDDVERPSMTWQQWFSEAGADLVVPPPRLVYNAYPTVVQEALAGNGIVLGWRHLLNDLVDRGLLVPVGPLVERDRSGHHLCWRTDGADARHRAILELLQTEIHASSASFAGWA